MMNHAAAEKSFLFECPSMMDVTLRGEAALNVARIKGKYAICARRDASSRTLAFHFAEMDDAVTVFKSRLIKTSISSGSAKSRSRRF